MDNYNRPFLIAVSGGIASGKSLVAEWFAQKGLEVHSADAIAHQVLQQPEVINKIADLFGAEVIDAGKVKRQRLAEIVFKDKNKLEQLNEIIHPQVRAEMQSLILLSNNDHLVLEIPLLFENNLQAAFDLTINVSASAAKRIERIKQRDGLNVKAAEQRLQAQLPEFDRQKLADINISNEGSREELYERLERLFPLIQKLNKKQVKKLTEL